MLTQRPGKCRITIESIALDAASLEKAARYAARCEGLHPDGITCAGRAQWEVYAQYLRTVYLPAIEHALAGVQPEGTSDEEAHTDTLDDPDGRGRGLRRDGADD